MTSARHSVPTPAEMLDLEAPELAILAALDTTLEATTAAMRVANPEVLHADKYDARQPHSPEVWIAEAFVAEARMLRAIIDRYRHSIYLAHARRCADQDTGF